mgnify:CR=1 FL=1
MIKYKVRDLMDLPSHIKLEYFKLLFIVAKIDGDLNPMELMELYRLMARGRLGQRERLYLIENIDKVYKEQEDLAQICRKMLQDLKGQEKNILTFSLVKDIIIVINADYHESLEEEQIFIRIRNYLNVTDDQLESFKEEYDRDRVYFEDAGRDKRLIDGFLHRAPIIGAMGISLGILYNRLIRKKRTIFKSRGQVTPRDGLMAMTGAILSHEILRVILDKKSQNEEVLKQALYRHSLQIADKALAYLKRDGRYFQRKLVSLGEVARARLKYKEISLLMKKTQTLLQNTKATLL